MKKIGFFAKSEKIKLCEDKKFQLLKDIDKIDPKRLNIASTLIEEISFMYAELCDLREIIKSAGSVEIYQNGANQYGLKKSAATDAYNTTVKNYVAILKQFVTMIYGDNQELNDGFDEFLDEK